MMAGKAGQLTRSLFSLDEPWRGRFLTLVANRATRRVLEEQRPTCGQVVAWLEADPALCQWVASLLDVWQGPGDLAVSRQNTVRPIA